jgi:L-ascorbate metabolism protein UlaG (beta-lactamase superfamily)
MNNFKVKIMVILLFCSISFILAQNNNNKKLLNPCLDRKSNEYIDRQDFFFLNEINKILQKNHPKYPVKQERKQALFLLDAVLHDKYAAFRKPVQQFYHNRIKKVIDELKNTKIERGVKIWKLYNMGFIAKTKSVTIAFDLVRGNSSGSRDFELSDATMEKLVNQCDVLFISHRHRDHVDKETAKLFINKGKPVVANSQVWSDDPIYKEITHLKREANKKQTLKIKNGNEQLDIVIYPGHQMSKTLNNVVLVFTPEGITISHMGDQINEGDFMIDYNWIDNVSKNYHVDILLPPCWTNELYRIVKGFNPQLVIPGHENELGHPVDDRVPFWGDVEFLQLTNDELYKSNYSVIQMIWGESYHYLK